MTRIGDYEVVAEIARGAGGRVFRARADDGRVVAVKLLVLGRGDRDQALARFERERRLLGALGEAEGFVGLVGAGRVPEGFWVAMPFVGDGTLRARLDRGRLSIEEAVRLGVGLAAALGKAHECGIVHRDLKPENVLFTADGRPLVADLGLAKHFRRDAPGASQSVTLSRDGSFKGTVGYMAPEQMDHAESAGPQADVFALGAILYECLAGIPAFEGATPLEVLGAAGTGAVKPLRAVRPEVPAWLADAIGRALLPDPAARFPDARALAAALSRPLAAPARGRWPLVGGLAAVGAIGAALFLLRSPLAPESVQAKPSPAPSKARPSPAAAREPAWFAKLPSKPSLPLPPGVTFGTKPGEYVNEKDGSVLLYVPGGKFLMGSDREPGRDDERPVHEVELSPYFVGKLEVSNAQFARFVEKTHHVTQAERAGHGGVSSAAAIGIDEIAGVSWARPDGQAPAGGDLPVVQVSWDDAHAYAAWAGLQIPTEAEWERAAGWDAAAGRARVYAWGDEVPGKGSPLVGNLAGESFRPFRGLDLMFLPGYEDGYHRTAPVGHFPAGASPVGALDMTGNVSEMCEDGYDAGFYRTSPRRDPIGTATQRGITVVRGGDWGDVPTALGVSHRVQMVQSTSADRVGFRVALAPARRP